MPPTDNRFFDLFSTPVADRLRGEATRCPVEEGAVLFDEGDPADDVILLDSGRVELLIRDPVRDQRLVATVQAGDYFGEMGVMAGLPRSARATMAEAGQIRRIPGLLLHEALRTAPNEAVMELYGRVVASLRELDSRFVTEMLRRERLALLGDVANKVVHDLKGPVTAISLALEVLRMKSPSPDQRSICETMGRNLDHMQGMLEEILDFSAGRPRIRPARVGLRSIIESVVADNGPMLKIRGVQVRVEGEEAMVRADPRRFTRVLLNLLINAAEALSGRPGACVEFTVSAGDGMATVRVADNGPGIPHGMEASIFEPFVSVGKPGGSGLGLAVAKNVVEAHGGTIDVGRSEQGGALFTIRLPLSGVGDTSPGLPVS